ncbi:MAG: hypothetical protein MRY63_09060 [Neomegalonema sp.]|nr:hypothetical protein [Neomegalonema sp.]
MAMSLKRGPVARPTQLKAVHRTIISGRALLTALCKMFALALAALALSQGSAHAGAWTLPAGQARLYFDVIATTRKTDTDALGAPAKGSLDKLEAYVAVEHGLSDWLTMGTKTGYALAVTRTDGFDFSHDGLSQMGIWGRARLWQDHGYVLSAQARYTFQDFTPPLGELHLNDGIAELDGRLLLGHGFRTAMGNAWWNVETGYLHRLGNSADQLRLDTTLGIRPAAHSRLVVLGQSHVILSAPGGDVPGYDEVTLTGKIGYDVTDWLTLTVGAQGTPYANGQEPALGASFGMWIAY